MTSGKYHTVFSIEITSGVGIPSVVWKEGSLSWLPSTSQSISHLCNSFKYFPQFFQYSVVDFFPNGFDIFYMLRFLFPVFCICSQ